MTFDQTAQTAHGAAVPSVREVHFDQPWVWMQKGWDDMWRAPHISLVGGGIFALVGAVVSLIAYLSESAFVVLPFAAGFLLVGPIAAVGAYDISRRLHNGEPLSLRLAVGAFGRNASQIGLMTGLLLIAFLLWVRSAMLIFMLFFSYAPPGLDGIIDAALFSDNSIAFLIVGNGIGALFAAVTFAFTVVSVPMLLDRTQANVVTAAITSMRAAFANPRAMVVWASLIVLFIGAGIMTFFLGLIVTLPLIGHATWHAYKDLVGE